MMVAPLIPAVLIGTGVITGLGGAASAFRGAQKMRRARAEARSAESRYDQELNETRAAVETTNTVVCNYGDRQAASLDGVVHRMADFLRRNEQQVAERASELFDGVMVDTKRLDGFEGGRITAEGLAGHAVKAAIAGVATYSGLPIAVATYGSASTGTAIVSLSGAAARNATMAWLGGGSVAAGGGGMALGAMALNFVTVGPTILVGGLVLNGKGEKALTEARRYTARVEKSVADQFKLRNRLDLVVRRGEELEALLVSLTKRGTAALDELESSAPFDSSDHAEPFRRALAYAIAVRDVVSTPVLDADGELDPDTERLLITYRGMT